MMPLNEGHHVSTQRAAIRDRYTDGVNVGVDLERSQWPAWIAAIYAAHGPHDRGVLLGVLLDEWQRMQAEDAK